MFNNHEIIPETVQMIATSNIKVLSPKPMLINATNVLKIKVIHKQYTIITNRCWFWKHFEAKASYNGISYFLYCF